MAANANQHGRNSSHGTPREHRGTAPTGPRGLTHRWDGAGRGPAGRRGRLCPRSGAIRLKSAYRKWPRQLKQRRLSLELWPSGTAYKPPAH
eukprot:12768646-Alexandrium_andersonii.AAC.1